MQGNALPIEDLLQNQGGVPDLGAGIVVEARQDVWRAGDNSDAICDAQLRHLYRNSDVPRTIVHAGQNMAMEIDHLLRTSRRLPSRSIVKFPALSSMRAQNVAVEIVICASFVLDQL